MAENPGFPGEGFDFGYAEAGADLAGLVVRDTSGNVRSGVMPSTANLITGRSDWNVDVAPFVVVRGDGPRVLLGGVDASLQVAIAPAPASNSRIDLVWALARNVGAGDIAGCVHVVTGVPGVSPVKPSLPAGGVELGTVTVPATATGTSSATIANTFRQTCSAGGVIPFRNAADRDSFAAVDGQLGLVGSTLYERSEGAWVLPIRRGTVAITTGPLPAIAGNPGIFGATATFSIPAVAGANEAVNVTALAVGSGFGILSQVNAVPTGGVTNVTCRFVQIGSSASQNLTILWEIVPIS